MKAFVLVALGFLVSAFELRLQLKVYRSQLSSDPFDHHDANDQEGGDAENDAKYDADDRCGGYTRYIYNRVELLMR